MPPILLLPEDDYEYVDELLATCLSFPRDLLLAPVGGWLLRRTSRPCNTELTLEFRGSHTHKLKKSLISWTYEAEILYISITGSPRTYISFAELFNSLIEQNLILPVLGNVVVRQI